MTEETDITEYVNPEGICEECRRFMTLHYDGIAWLCETCYYKADDEE